MSHFDAIPDELIYDMCKQWDNRTLLNMSEAYSRVYQVCSEIIEQRKFYTEVELRGMVVAKLKLILKAHNLKIPKLKADMIKLLNGKRK